MWVIPPKSNPDFVFHMEDVLDVYQRPYDPRRPLICMDETTKQLVGEIRTPLPPLPGVPARYDAEYVRNGVANLFLFSEPLAGQRQVRVREQRTKQDWAWVMRELIDETYADAERIVLVMDNLNTHSPASFYATFPPEVAKRLTDRLEIHYTPKHGSWLNMAEIELSVLSKQCLKRRIPTLERLRHHVAAWEEKRNQSQRKIRWQFTTKDARIKLRSLYPSV
jgi:transposase